MTKKAFFIIVLCLSLVTLAGTDATARSCRPIGGTVICRHEVCFEIDYKAMNDKFGQACLAVYWETLEGGVCRNPALHLPPDQPADLNSEFYPTDVYTSFAAQAQEADKNGNFTLFQCFEPCDILNEAGFNPCNNNWDFICNPEQYPVNALSVLTWNAGYRNYDFQQGLCIRWTAEACSDNPADADYDEECGSCGYTYSEEIVPEQECIDANLISQCETAIAACEAYPGSCEPPSPEE